MQSVVELIFGSEYIRESEQLLCLGSWLVFGFNEYPF